MVDKDKKNNNVAIIGGGVSGICCMKYLKEKNIKADLFEAKSELTGVWSTKDGFVWKEMTTNLSQFNCQFSDHFWDLSQPRLPSSLEVYNYLNSYIEKHSLIEFHNIHFNSKVVKVISNNIEKSNNNIYEVEVEEKDLEGSIRTYKENYNFVIVCCGVYNDFQQLSSKISHLENFKGKIFHSSEFRSNSSDYLIKKFKKFLIVGFSYSGGNIAEALVNSIERNATTEDGLELSEDKSLKKEKENYKICISKNRSPFLHKVEYFCEESKVNFTYDILYFKRFTDKIIEHYITNEKITLDKINMFLRKYARVK